MDDFKEIEKRFYLNIAQNMGDYLFDIVIAFVCFAIGGYTAFRIMQNHGEEEVQDDERSKSDD